MRPALQGAHQTGSTPIFTASEDDNFYVAINIEFGEEKDQVTDAIAKRLKEIAGVLFVLKPNSADSPGNE